MCTKPAQAQAQAQENPIHHSGAFGSDRIWEEEEWYSVRVWTLLGQPHSSGRLRVHRIWTIQSVLDGFGLFCLILFFKDTRFGEYGKGHWTRSSWGVVAMIKILCTKFYKTNTNVNKEWLHSTFSCMKEVWLAKSLGRSATLRAFLAV